MVARARESLLCFLCLFVANLISPTLRAVILIGLLGGFTTFSSYGLQTFTLLRDGQIGLATLNIAVSNVLGLLMVWVGYVVSKAL